MRNPRAATRHAPRRKVRGLSLIELMIALVLGLVVVGAAGGVFLANRRVYAASETLNRVQENGRVSFELMARDLREAGGNPCGVPLDFGDAGTVNPPVVNMLNRTAGDWYEGLFASGIRGYGPGGISISDSVDIGRIGGDGAAHRILKSDNAAAVLEVDHTDGLEDGDIVMACNSEKAVIFQVTGTPAGKKVQLHKGGGPPGNCDSNLQANKVEPKCVGSAGGNKNLACFTADADKKQCTYTSDYTGESWYSPMIVKAGGVRWYVAANGRGGTSLYRARLDPTTTGWAIGAQREEIAEGVTALRLRYRLSTDPGAGFRTADKLGPGDWAKVNAVEVAITSAGVAGNHSAADVKGTDGKALERTFTYVVALRNRES